MKMHSFSFRQNIRTKQIWLLLPLFCYSVFGKALDKPICGPLNDIADGEWVLDPDTLGSLNGRQPQDTPASGALCCGWDDGGRFGATQDPRCSGATPRVGGYGCVCQRSAMLYSYQPRSCTLPPFNKASFCDAINNTTFVFVGDSVMQQVWYSLHMALLDSTCSQHVLFEHSDTLTGEVFGSGLSRGLPLPEIAKKWQLARATNRTTGGKMSSGNELGLGIPAQVTFVVGLGAHIHKPEEYIRVVKFVRQLVMEHKLSLLWVPTLTAHARCHNVNAPVDETVADAIIAASTELSWNLFPMYGFLATHILSGYTTLPFSKILKARVDGHSVHDCTHWCVPVLSKVIPPVFQHVIQTYLPAISGL
jgi:hypothetical protein